MSELQRYKDWAPTKYDTPGLALPDRREWFVVPLLRTRDSETLEESNFATALGLLGDESETLEVHRFGHWGPGWYEVILAHPDREADVREIQGRLEQYPVLDEDDWGRREDEEWEEAWGGWLCDEVRNALSEIFPDDSEMVDEQTDETIYEIYTSVASFWGRLDDYTRPRDVARTILES